MKRFRAILVVSVVLSFAFAANTIADEGYYIGGQGGFNLANNKNITAAGGAPGINLGLDTGWAAGLVIGYQFKSNWSLEFEFTHRENSIDGINVLTDGGLGSALGTTPLSGPLTPANGQINSNSYMLNAYYNFYPKRSFHPFVGIGAGISNLKFSGIQGGVSLPALAVSQKDTAFTIQGIAGVKKRISEAVSLILSYRFTHMNGTDMVLTGGFPSSGNINHHTFMLGLVIKLGGPKVVPKVTPPSQPTPAVVVSPPPPPPEPVVEPEPVKIPGPFLVFFDWDSDVIDNRARAVLREAATAFQQFGIARIVAVGHADRSGPEEYNENLSHRRVEAVEAALASLGILAGVINSEWRGEKDPRVGTADGVRERQNRSVEITLVE